MTPILTFNLELGSFISGINPAVCYKHPFLDQQKLAQIPLN
jgi:hypothetical protein